MSFLDALDDSLETAPVPTIGAFQPKVKPRGKKPNVAAKSKVAAAGQKNAKQQSAKVALPESVEKQSAKVALDENSEEQSAKVGLHENSEEQFVKVALSECAEQQPVKVALPEYSEEQFVKVALPESAEQEFAKVALPENAKQQSVEVSLPENSEQQRVKVALPENSDQQSFKAALPDNDEQGSVKFALPETNSPLKENHLTPAEEIDVRPDASASSICIEVDPVEEKPISDTLELTNDLNEQIDDQRRGWRKKLKEKSAVDNSEMIPTSVELATGSDQDHQYNIKSKQERPKMRGHRTARGSKKLIQESATETLGPSNVEAEENGLDSNVGIDLNVPSGKKNSQSRRQKRKATPSTNSLDDNNLNTDLANTRQSSEDQELTEKPIRKKRKASTNGKSLESKKVKFSHSTVRRRRRVEQHLLDTPEADLDTSKMTLKDIIRLAEAKERKQKKEELTKNKSQTVEAASNSNVNEHTKEPEEDEGDILAPQVKVVNGQIVINEESLVVSHRDLNTDDFRTYRRVEESTSKLNYHTYMNRSPAERWSKSDTELFYKAMQQFGTDFAMIKQLFPARTRRQVKAKFKIEERKNPLQLSDALFHKTQDHSHFQMLIDRLKISTAPPENGNAECKTSPSTVLEDMTLETPDEAHEQRGNNTQNNSSLDISEKQEIEQCEKRPVKERDSPSPIGSYEDISNIDEINKNYKHVEDSKVVEEASPSKENASNEPIAKPSKSLFSYQAGSTKPKSLFGYQL